MTCDYSTTGWRDVLYNSVRGAPGGVAAAAAFLTERRGRSIHTETLRSRLRGVDGETVSMEMAELLTEWMQEMNCGQALDWLHAMNGQFGMAAAEVETAPIGGWPDEIQALTDKLLKLSVNGGRLTEMGITATADGRIDKAESERLVATAFEGIRLMFRMVRNVQRAAGQPIRMGQPRRGGN